MNSFAARLAAAVASIALVGVVGLGIELYHTQHSRDYWRKTARSAQASEASARACQWQLFRTLTTTRRLPPIEEVCP